MNIVPAMTDEAIRKAELVEEEIKKFKHIDIPTFHTLHNGVYTRTIILKPGEVASGVIIEVPTTLIVSGHLRLLIDNEVKEIKGFNVFLTEAHRKQVAIAVTETTIVMLFKTEARTVEEAEREFTSEPDKLASRLPTAINHIKQGVLLCQE